MSQLRSPRHADQQRPCVCLTHEPIHEFSGVLHLISMANEDQLLYSVHCLIVRSEIDRPCTHSMC